MTQLICPLCQKPALEAFKPFCSKRCADVDLNRWLGGVYAVPDSVATTQPDEVIIDNQSSERHDVDF